MSVNSLNPSLPRAVAPLAPLPRFRTPAPSRDTGLRLLDDATLRRAVNTPPFDFARFERDRGVVRVQIETAKARGDDEQEGPDPDARLVRILAAYEHAARDLSSEGSPRDTAQLIAWTRQAGAAVSPRFRVAPLSATSDRRFGQFVEASVVLVILLEDIGETFRGPRLEPLAEEVFAVAENWIQARLPRGRGCAGRRSTEPASPAARTFLRALHESFSLFEDLTCGLLPRATRSPDALALIRGYAAECVREVLDAVKFSRRFDRLARGKGGPFLHLINGRRHLVSVDNFELEEFLCANQANIFMRFFLTMDILRHHDACNRGGGGSTGELTRIVASLRPLGDAIEQLGNMSNDLATLFRELGEGFVANFVLAEALKRKAFSPQVLSRAFVEIEKTIPTAERKAVLQRLALAFFEGGAEREIAAFSRTYPGLVAFRSVLDAIRERALIPWASKCWQAKFAAYRSTFGREHPLDRLIDLEGLWIHQARFLLQYLAANGLV